MVNNINSIMYNLSLLNEQNNKVNYSLSSGEALEYGSDDSLLYSYIIDIENDINIYSNIQEGIETNSAFNLASDSTLSEVKYLVETIKAEIIKANTDTVSQDEKELIASQIEEYKTTLLTLANTSINDQYIFSGENTSEQPFVMDENGIVSYQSDDSIKSLNIEKGTYTKQGVNGIDAFYYLEESIEPADSFTFSSNEIILDEEGNQWKLDGLSLVSDSGSISVVQNSDGTFSATNSSTLTLEVHQSIFNLLNSVTNALKLQDSDGNDITEDEANQIITDIQSDFDEAYDSLNTAHTLVGIRTNTIDNYSSSIQTKLTNLAILEEEYASADLTSLAVEAQSLENTYTALYSTINRVNSLSLVNFLN